MAVTPDTPTGCSVMRILMVQPVGLNNKHFKVLYRFKGYWMLEESNQPVPFRLNQRHSALAPNQPNH